MRVSDADLLQFLFICIHHLRRGAKGKKKDIDLYSHNSFSLAEKHENRRLARFGGCLFFLNTYYPFEFFPHIPRSEHPCTTIIISILSFSSILFHPY